MVSYGNGLLTSVPSVLTRLVTEGIHPEGPIGVLSRGSRVTDVSFERTPALVAGYELP